MHNHFYAMMSRMKNIYRWGLMRNTRKENLSEHSLEVAMIAHALAIIRNKRLGGEIDPNFVATAAMFHDSSEIITGDMPTPIKYYNSEIKKVYKEIEQIAEQRLLSLLPEDLREEFMPLYNPDPQVKKIIKAADKISALIKCIEESGMGNSEFLTAERTIRAAIAEMALPEADIFMDEFIKSFSLNLDEQNELNG